jgi:tetratricopeptide (TPR) repeat protein
VRGTSSHGTARHATSGHRPSIDLTIGRTGNRFSGYLHLSNRSAGAGLYGALYYNGTRGHYSRGDYYGYGHYYRNYRPIAYYGYDYYRPYYGYTYASIYYPYPYVYRFYDRDVYYVDQIVEQQNVYDAPAASRVDTTQDPPAQTSTYPVLTQPGDTTLIGQGNGAFTAGRYDEARRFYVSAMLSDERDGYAKFLYALANLALRDYAVAATAMRRALLTTPALIDYPVDVRSLYEDQAVFEAQLGDLTRHVAGHADDRGALLLLGYFQYVAGRPEQALTILDKLAADDPDDTVAALLRDAVLRATRDKKPNG